MKIVETIYTGHNWRTGEDNADRCIKVALVDNEGSTIQEVSFAEGEPKE